MDLTPVHFGQLWTHPSTIRVAFLHPALLLLIATIAVPILVRKHFAPLATWLRVAAMSAIVLALAGLCLTARLPDQFFRHGVEVRSGDARRGHLAKPTQDLEHDPAGSPHFFDLVRALELHAA